MIMVEPILAVADTDLDAFWAIAPLALNHVCTSLVNNEFPWRDG